ncbi:phenylalanine--tRNA ligase subunit beta [Lascolabacillus sp.]|jgi:phenylalanyl-tRNA synthetase beta chain|uniref:phenylalanine--tRNA ligase subunit beta n=1 Tax=Lascolabacillus sp. TaxID=1924068 RepID=UPI000AF7470B|nr:phenylalanine--tRNA ligase subunit beta [Lascolabacillus sp.]MCK9500555.1 phenylalanine--tRNA ligase subunit beta [Lascolabacillus sp.]MDD2606757.1 phenylalanine--tRNA ligase subunit beta [Lascolabacillus sp.]MDI9625389.1 phenylalanine--tRNA ligase subunit beta [Bacteroidota bacterium]TAH60825.1 MAG: phenylalanine--tRNA ligase subunit beta [Fermentimonas caenicola]
MNISYNWLKEYLKFDLTPQQTSEVLTQIGLETESVEEVQTIKGGLKGLVIGEVLTCKDHPNSDHLHLTTVNIGDGNEPLNIVCGAPNVTAGQKVVVATVGTTLYSGEEEFKIKRSKIRGEESLGMICSEAEIGLSNNHDGIIVLPEDAVVGTPAAEYYNVQSDWVFSVDITPNRVDAASHYGIARDLAAYLKQQGKSFSLTKPSVDDFAIDKKDGGIEVIVENREACPRYSGLTIRGVTVKESPDWLKNKLLLIGLRPINNIVDITNFILYETGHPMHAFDAAYIKGDEVVIRTLPEKTKFTTLDDQERELSDKDLMICNSEEGMCIAGVFGGKDSGVTENTKDIFLESAYFHPTWVRKTARRHGLNTDSSFRFERGADPNNTVYALKRAALLVKEIAGGEIAGEIRDIYPVEIERPKVVLSYDKTNKLIGKEIPKDDIKSILKSLDIEIEAESESELTLRIPTYRVDVTRDVDVIEDILRIYGYNNVEVSHSLKANLSYKTATDRKQNLQTLISEQLTANGFDEIMNNSLTKKSYYEIQETYPLKNCVTLVNPLSNDLSVMRQTLLFGGLESIVYNRNRKHSDLCFYEFGNCYFYDADKKKDNDILAEYSESTYAGLWITGKRTHKNWAAPEEQSSVFELKAHIENIMIRIGIGKDRIIYEPLQNDLFSTAMSIGTNNRKLGYFGVVSKAIRKSFDIESEVFFAELNWDLLMKDSEKHKVQFFEISRFPEVSRDLALLIDKSVTFAQIEQVALKSERKLLKNVVLFDVYEGKNLPEGKKSYAVNFIIQDEEKTLTDKQIDKVMSKIQQNLQNELGAQLR